MAEKKIAIIGAGVFTGDDLMTRAQKEVDRILSLEKEDRPEFSILVIGDAEINTGVGLALMKEAMKLEVPILICSAKHKEEIEAMEKGKLSKLLSEVNSRTEMIFKIERTMIPEMPTLMAERYPEEKNHFGGHKKSKNQKLRRR